MRYSWLLEKIQTAIKDDNSYNSLVEEALKLCLKAAKTRQPLLIVKENNYLAARLYDIMSCFFSPEEIALYLPEESMRSEEIATSYENRAARLNALYQIITSNTLKVVITSPYGYCRHLPAKEELLANLLPLKTEQTLSKEELVAQLQKMGYEKMAHVETPMTFASRGYIVDVFSINYDHPLRIEFFDDIIDSIRFFDINSQRTLEEIGECTIVFAKDVFFSAEEKDFIRTKIEPLSGEMEIELQYLLNDIYRQSQYFYYAYFPKSHLKDLFTHQTYLSDQEKISDHLKILNDETIAYLQEMHEEKRLPLRFYVMGEFSRLLAGDDFELGEAFASSTSAVSEIDMPKGSLDQLLTLVNRDPHTYRLIIAEKHRLNEIIDCLKLYAIDYSCFETELRPGILLVEGELFCGFRVEGASLSVYSADELFALHKPLGKYATKYAEAQTLNSYEELHKGDYVVHDQYGIGQYECIEKRVVNGIALDYLKIIYKGNDELLVPLSKFNLVRKYVSREGAVPKLHKLGSKDWVETRKKVEESVNDIAQRLLDLYAQREENIGFAYSPDNELMAEFEAAFEYELTDDQKTAIAEVKADMESSRPMDRLLCGDVGFGKTEVALRAAFKAVNDNKQVAYLCPTTILSLQHYNTFKKRLAKFPCRVELLNRFVPEKQQQEIIKGVKDGSVDIIIGTHRILSNDLKFKDLGLLIIDEEQRFGVEHKEKIKEMKTSIDVLSLSATPIPRTLQLSLIGLQGLSNLNTPPVNRYPVQTYVVSKHENLVKEVIMRELERKGQVFYLFNNTEQIYNVANQLARSIPYAKVGVAHGKMHPSDIEEVMFKFYNNELNVLVCTTIVETGIDIPNANTIIVDNAQNFGLSQLYQIKGRVGRSDRIAYAYLLIPQKRELKEISLKRLEAIKEFASLGSGYKIAMRDLTIRGAGDLLGPKQSGHIDNVGLDLYLSLLAKAIRQKKGEEVIEEVKQVAPLIPLESYIPDSFSDNDYEKLAVYHRLADIRDKQELLAYLGEVKDEYGTLPEAVASLFKKKQLELMINLAMIEKVSNAANRFTVTLSKEFSDQLDGLKLFSFCNEISKDIGIAYKKGKLELFAPSQQDGIAKVLKVIENLENLKKDEN